MCVLLIGLTAVIFCRYLYLWCLLTFTLIPYFFFYTNKKNEICWSKGNAALWKSYQNMILHCQCQMQCLISVRKREFVVAVVKTEPFHHEPLVLCWIELWWLGMEDTARWTDCGVQDSTLIWLNTVSYPSASSHQEMMDVVGSNTRGGCSVQTRLDRCKRAERVSPPTSHQHYQLPTVKRGNVFPISYCHVICSLAICIHKLLNVRLIKLFLFAIFAFF